MQGMFHSLKHLALIAMILRAMLPAGWMPSATADAPFTICSVDPAHQKQPDNKAPERANLEKPCAFSGVPQLAATPILPALILPALHGLAAQSDRVYAAQIAAHHQPQSPRAPPLNA